MAHTHLLACGTKYSTHSFVYLQARVSGNAKKCLSPNSSQTWARVAEQSRVQLSTSLPGKQRGLTKVEPGEECPAQAGFAPARNA